MKTNNSEQILQNSNPIDSIVDYLIHFIEAKNIDVKNNSKTNLRIRIVDGMFQNSMARLSPETQVAMLKYVEDDATNTRKEQFLISLGSSLSVLIRNIALNNDKYIENMSSKTDTYPIYHLLTNFANDYEHYLKTM
jgi:hypothetical protein